MTVCFLSVMCQSQSVVFNEKNPQFESVEIGKSSKSKAISAVNGGGSPLLISQIIVSDGFAQSNDCKTWFFEGSGCVISVVFRPIKAGKNTGDLTIVFIDGSEQSVTLAGVGLPVPSSSSDDNPHTMLRTTNDEERAQELLNDKRHSFQDLLNKDTEAVANARKTFALTHDTATKERVASVLMSIGLKDQIYLDYLTENARIALLHDQDYPWPMLYDEQKVPKVLNEALNDWCKAHKVGFWTMHNVQYYEIPAVWYHLAAAGDLRLYDLLVQGLHSQNYMIGAWAALGLAKLQDPRAVDQLIAAGHQVSGEALETIAQSLLYFPSPKAQRAAQDLMPGKDKEKLLESYRAIVKSRGVQALP